MHECSADDMCHRMELLLTKELLQRTGNTIFVRVCVAGRGRSLGRSVTISVSAPPIFFNEIFLCVKHYHQDDLMLLMCSYSVFDAVLSVKRGTGTFFENEGNEDFLRGNCPQSFFFLPSLYQSLAISHHIRDIYFY